MSSNKVFTPIKLKNKDTKLGLCKDNSITPRQISKRQNVLGRSSMQDLTDTTHTEAKNPNVSDSVVHTQSRFCTPTRYRTPNSKILTGTRSKSATTLNTISTPLTVHRSVPSTPVNRLKIKTMAPQTPECYNRVVMETPRPKNILKHEDTLGEASNLNVAVRVRPMNSKELSTVSVSNIVIIDQNEVTVLAGTSADSSAGVSHSFVYDQAFWSCDPEQNNYADQLTVFKGVAMPLIDKAFEGYNACLFAYGQTGSGKSYSMMGIDNAADDYDVSSEKSEAGIIPRFCHELFRRIEELDKSITATVEVSYFEIYNEKIHDLLAVGLEGCSRKAPLKVREHPELGPYVVDLSTQAVNSHIDLRKWLAVGNSQRATAATGMNDKSSRSHSIFSVVLNLSSKEDVEDKPGGVRSKVSLVDLAGSERVSSSCAKGHTSVINSGERLREGVSINKSLLTLGKVIASLAMDNRKNGHIFVPYRESVLTWLLRESLGGNSRTSMLATISPASGHLDETLATLRYACQARTIVNRVRINEDPHDKLIRELRAEVDRLRGLRQDYERQKRHFETGPPTTIIIETTNNNNEVEHLRQQLAETEIELAHAQKSWKQRLREAAFCQESEMKLLRKRGVALELTADQRQPCLVNLSTDPMLTGTLLYLLPPGTIRIGRPRPDHSYQPDIILDSPLIAYEHCSIQNVGGELTLITQNFECETFVNGEVVFGSYELKHGDRLVIGGNHYFRVSNPNNIEDKKVFQKPIDFELAHQEILKKQEYNLRCELKTEKEKAIQQLEMERLESEKLYLDQLNELGSTLKAAEKRRDELESEARVAKNNSCSFSITPYKSTFLQDLAQLLGEEVPETYSLYELNLLVREARQRCQDKKIDIDFKQTQTVGPNGMIPMITLYHRAKGSTAQWAPARLEGWLNRIRESETNPEELIEEDMSWHEDDIPEISGNDFLNSSRISLNISVMKDSYISTPTVVNNGGDRFQSETNKSLDIIKREIKKIRRVAHEHASRRMSGAVSTAVDEMENVIEDLKSVLNTKDTVKSTKSVRFNI